MRSTATGFGNQAYNPNRRPDADVGTASRRARYDKIPEAPHAPSGEAMRHDGGQTTAPFVVPRKSSPAEIRSADLIVPESDHTGCSIGLKLKITPAMERILRQIVQSRKYPYQTVEHIIRHAVMRHLTDMAVLEADGVGENALPNSSMSMLMMMQRDVLESQILNDQINEVMSMLSDQAAMMIGDGEVFEGRKLLAQIEENLRRFPDSVSKRKFVAKFKARFGDFLKRNHAKVAAGRLDPIANSRYAEEQLESLDELDELDQQLNSMGAGGSGGTGDNYPSFAPGDMPTTPNTLVSRRLFQRGELKH